TASFAPGAGNSTLLDTHANDFATVAVSNGVNARFQDANTIVLGAITVSGALEVSSGGDITQSAAVTVGGTANINAGNGQIDLAGVNNDFGGVVTLSNVGAANGITIRDVGNLSLAGISAPQNLTLQAGATISQLGVFDVAGDFTIAGGTLDTGGNAVLVGGNWLNSGTFQAAGGTVTFNGGVIQTVNSGGTPAGRFNNVTVSGGGTVLRVAGSDFYVDGILTVAATTVDLADRAFVIDELANNGTLELDGTQSQTINNPDTASGLIRYKGAIGGTLGLSQFHDLEVNQAARTFTLTQDIRVHRDLIITPNTTLDSGGFDIAVGRHWRNLNGSFVPGTGTVLFFGPGGIEVLGHNDFYNFFATIDDPDPDNRVATGITIEFQAARVQRVLTGGTFRVTGGAAGWDGMDPPGGTDHITLTSTSPGLNRDTDYWRFDLDPDPSTSLELLYVYVDYSWATPFSIPIPPDTAVSDRTDGWTSFINVLTAETVDFFGTGKIDRILMTSEVALNMDFSDVPIEVEGYEPVPSGIPPHPATPFSPGPVQTQFFIHIQPRAHLDTFSRPRWRFVRQETHSLRDQATGNFLVVMDDGADYVELVNGDVWVRPLDGAAPVIGYTLAVAGRNQVFVHFSEPVQQTGGGSLTDANFGYSVGGVSVTAAVPAPGGVLDQDWLLTLSAPVTPEHIIDQETVLVSNVEDLAEDYTPDPAPNAFVARPVWPAGRHRVSDLLLIPPDLELVTPVLAREIGIQRDATRGGIGLIRDFDGTAYLQPREILLQVFASDPPINPATLRLFYDSAVSPALVRNRLWLPEFNQSHFSGIVPLPNAGGPGEAAGVPVAGGLREYQLLADDPRIRSGVALDFFLRVVAGPPPLYAARVFNPGSPSWFRNVRPFSFNIAEVLRQRSSVSILNNVINPEAGERAYLHYELARAGTVSINVFNLGGDLVDVIHRGRLTAGEHSTSWDGTNRQGRIVARGIYFIRIRGPDIDEFRKVMVVK
ncbi:MAG: hypothetical protein EA384_08155, partial [Spirochaetaceae bacterium]